MFDTLMSESWWEILVTAYGFGAAMWEKSARSQRFGMFGTGRGGESGGYQGGVGEPRTGIIYNF